MFKHYGQCMFKGRQIIGVIVLYKHIFYFIIISTQKHVVGSYYKVIGRALLMNIHNIYSVGDITKTWLFKYTEYFTTKK